MTLVDVTGVVVEVVLVDVVVELLVVVVVLLVVGAPGRVVATAPAPT